MDPIRFVVREDSIDLRARSEDLRKMICESLVSQGDEIELAGAVRIGARTFSVLADEGISAVKRRLVDLSSRLRDQGETLGAMLTDERLTALVKGAGETSGVSEPLQNTRNLLELLDRALESLSFLEETPAVEVDLPRLHKALNELLVGAREPLLASRVAAHLTEVEFRL